MPEYSTPEGRPSLNTSPMSKATERQKKLLNVVNSVRRLQLPRGKIPQVAFFGNQSSGKSSVISSITSTDVPTKGTMCTRFATEFVLRHDEVKDAQITIEPSIARSAQDRQRLEMFRPTTTDMTRLGQIQDEAAVAMGIVEGQTNFAKDVLRIELRNRSTTVDLDIVDLPGIFQAGGLRQTEGDVDEVKSLVRTYMERPETIMVVVLSASDNVANQEVTKLARQYDRDGQRTLGVVCKLDRLEDEDSAKEYLEVASNTADGLKLALGWHLLRNKKPNEKDFTWEERNKAEADFFQTGMWAQLPASQKGIHAFKTKLASILNAALERSLPFLVGATRDAITSCEQEIQMHAATGPSMADVTAASQSFFNLMSMAISGRYDHRFFHSHATGQDGSVYLHTRIVECIERFKHDVRATGHEMDIVDAEDPDALSAAHGRAVTTPKRITRAQLVRDVALRSDQSGDIPGSINVKSVADLFTVQAGRWPVLVDTIRHQTVGAIAQCLLLVTEHVSHDKLTPKKLMETVVQPALDKLTRQLSAEIDNVTAMHTTPRPLTVEAVVRQQAQIAFQDEARRVLRESLMSVSPALNRGHSDRHTLAAPHAQVNMATAQTEQALITRMIPQRFAGAVIVASMEKYYQAQVSKLVDAFDIQRFYDWILKELPKIFCPETIAGPDFIADQLWDIDIGADAKRHECTLRCDSLRELLEELVQLQQSGDVAQASRKRDRPSHDHAYGIQDEQAPKKTRFS